MKFSSTKTGSISFDKIISFSCDLNKDKSGKFNNYCEIYHFSIRHVFHLLLYNSIVNKICNDIVFLIFKNRNT